MENDEFVFHQTLGEKANVEGTGATASSNEGNVRVNEATDETNKNSSATIETLFESLLLENRRRDELMNRMICQLAENSEGRDWNKYIEQDINTSENKSTGKTPFELLCGYLPRFEERPLRYLTTDNETYLEPKHMQDNARKSIADMQSPLIVVEVLPGDTNRISDITETSKRPQTTAHVSQLKLWKNYNLEEEMNETDEIEETNTEEEED
ncbi:hypothetical protein Trydic_g4066 [Trypoxylus dichotomus]